MKLFTPLLLCLALHCTSYAQTDNTELQQLYDADQADRHNPNTDWKDINKRDKERQARVYEMLDNQEVNTSNDYHNAAMIFQHGGDTIASGMAVKLMRK